jgi:hypothetical protein
MKQRNNENKRKETKKKEKSKKKLFSFFLGIDASYFLQSKN